MKEDDKESDETLFISTIETIDSFAASSNNKTTKEESEKVVLFDTNRNYNTHEHNQLEKNETNRQFMFISGIEGVDTFGTKQKEEECVNIYNETEENVSAASAIDRFRVNLHESESTLNNHDNTITAEFAKIDGFCYNHCCSHDSSTFTNSFIDNNSFSCIESQEFFTEEINEDMLFNSAELFNFNSERGKKTSLLFMQQPKLICHEMKFVSNVTDIVTDENEEKELGQCEDASENKKFICETATKDDYEVMNRENYASINETNDNFDSNSLFNCEMESKSFDEYEFITMKQSESFNPIIKQTTEKEAAQENIIDEAEDFQSTVEVVDGFASNVIITTFINKFVECGEENQLCDQRINNETEGSFLLTEIFSHKADDFSFSAEESFKQTSLEIEEDSTNEVKESINEDNEIKVGNDVVIDLHNFTSTIDGCNDEISYLCEINGNEESKILNDAVAYQQSRIQPKKRRRIKKKVEEVPQQRTEESNASESSQHHRRRRKHTEETKSEKIPAPQLETPVRRHRTHAPEMSLTETKRRVPPPQLNVTGSARKMPPPELKIGSGSRVKCKAAPELNVKSSFKVKAPELSLDDSFCKSMAPELNVAPVRCLVAPPPLEIEEESHVISAPELKTEKKHHRVRKHNV